MHEFDLIRKYFSKLSKFNKYSLDLNDDVFFDKKINLGLDLQGGSYLLLEIDNTPVIEQKLQNLTTTIRNFFKDQNIKINNMRFPNTFTKENKIT